MAYSYFYGYLSKILPDYGDNNVGIRENIEVSINFLPLGTIFTRVI